MDSLTELVSLPNVKLNPWSGLLSPFDVDQFFAEHWQRKPLYIQGNENKFSNLPGLQELPALLNGRFSDNNRWIKGHVHGVQGSFIDRAGNIKKISAVPSMWPDLFNAGVSLCFSALDQYDERLTQFVRGIASTTRYPGTIYTTGYLTPPSSGSVMHFDSQHTFFLQISGKKHWKFSQRPAWEEAPVNIPVTSVGSPGLKASLQALGIAVAGPEQTGIQEETLKSGDILYLPPGFWHEARTSDSHSFHYTLTFQPLGPWHLLITYLRRKYFENPSLRRDLRYAVESGDGEIAVLLEAAIAELRVAVNGLTPEDIESFFAQVTSDNMFKGQFMLP